MTGTIKHISDRDYGFLAGDDGIEYFFHRTDLDGLHLEDLAEGDSLEFLPTEAARGPRAAHVRSRSTDDQG